MSQATATPQVTMKGNPITLAGRIPQVGEKAPDATLVANDLSQKKISDYFGKTLIISVVPSLDTGICDLQTKRFNKEAGANADVQILTISMDLPFAQKRWCGATSSDKIVTLSDHRDASFGQAYGLLIPALRLLTRAVIVVDKEGIVRDVQIVKEVTTEPDYEQTLKVVKGL